MLSKDELKARSARLSLAHGMAIDPRTGTANDPFQEAQSQYAGPGWGQLFGGLQEQEENALLAGKNYRADFSNFGNTVSEGGNVPRGRGLSLAAMGGFDGGLNPLEEI